MKSWPIKPLGELLKVQNGFAFESEFFNDDHKGLPIIRIRDLARGFSETFYSGEHAHAFEVENGDYLIGMDGAFRCYRWGGGRALLNQRVCRLQNFHSDLNAGFVFYGINAHLQEIENNTPFVTVKHLSSKQISNIEMPVPPLAEQERIVKLLDEGAELRELRDQADRRTANLLPALFHEMFGNSDTNPMGWEVVTVGDVVQPIEFGISEALSKGCEFQPGRIAVLRIANITAQGEVDYSDLRYLKVSDKRRNQLLLQKGDLLFNWRNSPNWVGKTAMFDASEPCIFASFLYRVRVIEDKVDRVFLWFYFNLLRKNGFFESKCRQAVSQANFGRDELAAVRIILPPLELQNEFARRATEIHALQTTQANSRARLDALFQSMLHRAFNGEL